MIRTRSFAAVIVALICTIMNSAHAESVLRRTTLLVEDVERSRTFYEALGFTQWLDWSEKQDPDALSGLPLNTKPSRARIVIMAGKDPYIAMIGLLEYSGPPLAPSRQLSSKLGLKDIILVIETDDLSKIEQEVRGIGAPILRPPKPYSSDGPAGAKTGLDMLVEDPDGYVVEVSQVITAARR